MCQVISVSFLQMMNARPAVSAMPAVVCAVSWSNDTGWRPGRCVSTSPIRRSVSELWTLHSRNHHPLTTTTLRLNTITLEPELVDTSGLRSYLESAPWISHARHQILSLSLSLSHFSISQDTLTSLWKKMSNGKLKIIFNQLCFFG